MRRKLRLQELEAEIRGGGRPAVRPMPAVPSYLRTDSGPAVRGRLGTADPEAQVLRGYVVATHGRFKDDRGKFDNQSLGRIVELMNAAPNGVKSRFTHPDMSNDGLGKFLGRARNATIGTAAVTRDGQQLRVPAVRADLHLDPTSFRTPHGNLGQYVLDLAASDPDALSSSLVLRVDKVYDLDEKGQPKTDTKGNRLPPLWLPREIHGTDIVDTGAAVDGILSVGTLPLAALWQAPETIDRGDFPAACRLLDSVFAGQSGDVIRTRALSWLERYLDRRGDTGGVRAQATAWLDRYLAERDGR